MRGLSEDETRVWSLQFIQHLELVEDMIEEGLDNGECFSVIQSYQRRQEIKILSTEDSCSVFTVTIGEVLEMIAKVTGFTS